MNNPNRIKLRVDNVNSQHLHVTVFTGINTLANAGQLCLSTNEWPLIGAALVMGAEQTKGHLVVEFDEQRYLDYTKTQN